ncbi:MAG: hypothetical protein IKA64_04170 [Clostridia bacterium]|nr:hypothetical protein [Clostridia bacterium]
MSFFSKILRIGEKPGTYAYRRRRAEELHGEAVKYVTEHRDGNEDVIGRGGSLAVHGDTFIVDSSGERLFVCEIKNLDTSMLMSGDGVIISGPNMLEGGKLRRITVHFVYYRK